MRARACVCVWCARACTASVVVPLACQSDMQEPNNPPTLQHAPYNNKLRSSPPICVELTTNNEYPKHIKKPSPCIPSRHTSTPSPRRVKVLRLTPPHPTALLFTAFSRSLRAIPQGCASPPLPAHPPRREQLVLLPACWYTSGTLSTPAPLSRRQRRASRTCVQASKPRWRPVKRRSTPLEARPPRRSTPRAASSTNGHSGEPHGSVGRHAKRASGAGRAWKGGKRAACGQQSD